MKMGVDPDLIKTQAETEQNLKAMSQMQDQAMQAQGAMSVQ